MKNKWIIGILGVLIFGFITMTCNSDSNKNLKYSIQVNNQLSGAKAIIESDTVELYIHNFEYNHDTIIYDGHRGYNLLLIADGNRGSPNGTLYNAGWYSVTSDLGVVNDGYEIGLYSSFNVRIGKLKVNGVEYNFPNEGKSQNGNGRDEVVFGKPTSIWNASEYPDNFNGINITDSVISLKTILIVESGIIGTGTGYTNGLADDPYKFIKVEGKINE